MGVETRDRSGPPATLLLVASLTLQGDEDAGEFEVAGSVDALDELAASIVAAAESRIAPRG